MEKYTTANKYLQGFVILTSLSAVLSCQSAQILENGVTEADKSIILQEHNKLRASVAMGRVPGQPGAENMREMVWDEELAARAQKWADNCQFKHDPRRTIDRFTMGQNVAILWSTAPLGEGEGDFPSRIQSWFNEVQKYDFGSAWSPKTGHYSQLVWGETNLVGCGFTYYKDSRKYNKLFVCNYGPGGNVIGANPYEVGRPACTNYGMKPSYHYQGLCSVPANFQNTIEESPSFYVKEPAYTSGKSSYEPQQQQQQSVSQLIQVPGSKTTTTTTTHHHYVYRQVQRQQQQQQPKPVQQQQTTEEQLQQTQQQQPQQKPPAPDYDYSFKSFFKQLAANNKNPSYGYDWQLQ
ncbi:cysteine-rich venom protein kaouthin-2 [Condylostylus longicornis]|uniref:cysteine-rich venom protein kaouthin-2 n=1 Tax=Condylostylus longicornis TaxID=2530218 RepID=UPI00244DA407|nr:cysteine-rich venom protein kaouthin-2 [Condylostylus longicornis]